MPLIDIATAQPCFRSNIHTLRSETILHNNFVNINEKGLAFPWKSFSIQENASNFHLRLGRNGLWRGRLMIKSVATFEATRLTPSNKEFNLKIDVDSASSGKSLREDLTELDEREKLRRMRISIANKGNTPWNKGRKHTPETVQLIRERTRLAMQDPKVKMKLVNLGHAQTEETRMKIGVSVRMGWERRHEKLMLQEACHYEWQNLLAEAARKGLLGEEELQWNSYKILNELLEQEWVQSVEERKRTPRQKGSKRAPKSLEQRRKISEAIAAKWADPAYRNRVYSGLVKYHGITEGTERKPRRQASSSGETRKRSPSKRKADLDDPKKPDPKSQIQRARLKRSGMPKYKDPLVVSKLEMLKSIRAQRAAAESKKSEAIARAKFLIAEAEKAAEALEIAAKKSPIAQVSLVETRNLIAEAIQSITSIEKEKVDSHSDRSPSLASTEVDTSIEEETVPEIESSNQIVEEDLNGAQVSASSDMDIMEFNFEKSAYQNLSSDEEEVHSSSFSSNNLVNGKDTLIQMRSSDYDVPPLLLDDTIKLSNFTEQLSDPELNGSMEHANGFSLNGAKYLSDRGETPPKSPTTTKKWVGGRLVEVTE